MRAFQLSLVTTLLFTTTSLKAQPNISYKPAPAGGTCIEIELESGKPNDAEIILGNPLCTFHINGHSYYHLQFADDKRLDCIKVIGKDHGNRVVFKGAHTGDPGVTFYGGNTNDFVTNDSNSPMYALGGMGDDQIIGGNGVNMFRFDVLDGGPGNDIIDGRRGNDQINGGPGDDTLSGGPGNDMINGGLGVDFMWGGEDNDTILDHHTPWFTNLTNVPDKEMDVIWGGPGKDRILHRHYGSRVSLNGWVEQFELNEFVWDHDPAEDYPLEEKQLSWSELEYLFPQNAFAWP